MIAALQAGRVDAAVEAEPFVTQGTASGLRDLLPVTAKAMPNVPTLVYLTSKAYAVKHPDLVRAFVASVNAANTELAKDPEEVRAVGATSTTVNAAVLAKIVLPVFSDRPLAIGTLNTLQALMVKYKLLPAPVNLSPSVFTSAG